MIFGSNIYKVEQNVLSVYFLCIIKLCKILLWESLNIIEDLFNAHLIQAYDLYKSMCAFHFWPGQKHQKSHAGYKWIISRGCHDWADLRTVVWQVREDDRSLQDLPRTGRLQILDRQSLKAAVDADSGVTSRELAIEFGCCQRTIINALHDIGKMCTRGRWIPFNGFLAGNHKIQRMVTCQLMLSMAKKANFFDWDWTVFFNWRRKMDRIR